MLTIRKAEPAKASNPLGLLPVKNAKAIQHCTELYLGKSGITQIDNFDLFSNLQVLYLNGNRIEKIEKLEKCFRLKELYLQNNRISCLRGSLSNLRFLTRLSLSGNQLKNLEAALPLLSHMHLLQNLDLFGNPLAEEHNFRLHVIYNIPSLIMLDRLVVTKEEKADAEALYCRLIAEGVVKPLRRAQMVKMKPPLAFGKIFKPILIDEVANSKSKKLSLYHKLVRDTKRIRRERNERKRHCLLAQYGTSNAVVSIDPSDPLPIPSRFIKRSLIEERRRVVWNRIELQEDLQKALESFQSKEEDILTISEARSIIVGLLIGRRPVASELNALMASWGHKKEEILEDNKQEASVSKSDFISKLLEIEWETLEQDHLQLQSDQLFAKAKGCIEKGEERSAAEIAAAAIEILMLAHTDENGDYAQ